MTEPARSPDVLYDILNVLQRIESRLERHEERFKSLEHHIQFSRGGAKVDGLNSSADTPSEILRAAETLYISTDNSRPSRKGTPTNDPLPGDTGTSLKVPYSQWSINRLDRFLSLPLSKMIETRLGDCWRMPNDDRLPLKFFISNILKSNSSFEAPGDSFHTVRQPFERDLDFLCEFDSDLRAHPGNDFLVVDFDAADETRLYRMGDKAFGSELQVEAQGSKSAPWSRLM